MSNTIFPAHGTINRAKPRVKVLKKSDFTSTNQLQHSYPVKADVTIKSGQFIVLDGSGEWILATAGSGYDSDQLVYIANGDSSDLDAQATGNLVGLLCSDGYEVLTGYVDAGSGLSVGTPLTTDAAGNLVEAVAGDLLVAKVTKTGTGANDLIDLDGEDSTADDLLVARVVTLPPSLLTANVS